MQRFLSITEIAHRLNITAAAVAEYHLPEPDAMIGRTRGWKLETIERWNKDRPGHGGNPNWIKR